MASCSSTCGWTASSQPAQPSGMACWKASEVWFKSLCPEEKLARSLRSMAWLPWRSCCVGPCRWIFNHYNNVLCQVHCNEQVLLRGWCCDPGWWCHVGSACSWCCWSRGRSFAISSWTWCSASSTSVSWWSSSTAVAIQNCSATCNFYFIIIAHWGGEVHPWKVWQRLWVCAAAWWWNPLWRFMDAGNYAFTWTTSLRAVLNLALGRPLLLLLRRLRAMLDLTLSRPLLLTYLALSRPCALWRRFPGELLRMVLALSRLCGSMQLEWARHCGLGAGL